MDKFVRCVDGQTRDVKRKEEAKQWKNACMASKGQALQQKRKREEEQKAKKAQLKEAGQGPGWPRKAVGPLQQASPPETRTAQRKRKSRRSKPAVCVRPGQLKRNWWRPHLIRGILSAVRHCRSHRGAMGGHLNALKIGCWGKMPNLRFKKSKKSDASYFTINEQTLFYLCRHYMR
eukprot:1153127-Pelagomonas_calceolata.AAC.4